MIEVRQMTAGFEGLHRLLQEIQYSLFQRRPKNTIFSPPNHMQWLGRQGGTATGETAAARKGGKSISPAGNL